MKLRCPECERLIGRTKLKDGDEIECRGCGAVLEYEAPRPEKTPPKRSKSAGPQKGSGTAALIIAATLIVFGVIGWHIMQPAGKASASASEKRQEAPQPVSLPRPPPVDVRCINAVGTLGYEDTRYRVYFRNMDTADATGKLTVRVRDRSGKSLAWDVADPCSIPSGKIRWLALRGKPGQYVEYEYELRDTIIAQGKKQIRWE